jgi:hypothetical protein
MPAAATIVAMVELTRPAVVSRGVCPLKGRVELEPVVVVAVVAGPVPPVLVLSAVVPAVVTALARAVVRAAVLTGAEPAGVTTNRSSTGQQRAGML